MHGIKIKRPWTALIIFLFLDVVAVELLEIVDTYLFAEAAPLFIAIWLIGFINEDFRA